MSIRDKQIIGKDAFVELSYVDSNVQTSIVRVAIIRTQDNAIEPVLGTPLYKKILQDIKDDTLTGVYETLVNDYVIRYLVPMIEIELAPHINWEMRNKSVGTSSDETIAAGDQTSVYSLVEQVRKSTHRYKDRLIGYLCDQSSAGNLPEYKQAIVDSEETPPDREVGSTLGWSFL